jgi:hypothetical protein
MAKYATLYTYPWDLHDEGVEQALDVIVETGVTNVSLAVSYHVSTYFLPRNPKRKLYYGEDGAIYFHPAAPLYADTDLKPRISEVVTGPTFLTDLMDPIRKRGLSVTAWIVYGYNHDLPTRFPDAAKQNVFGDANLAQLSPSSPSFQNYALALTQDIVTNYQPDEVHLESISYLPFSYGFRNPKVAVEIGAFDAFLLGICFNRHSLSAATEAGVDAGALQEEVADYLRHSLARSPDAAAKREPTEAALREAFGGRLGAYLDTLQATATSLFESAARIVREGGAATSHNWPRPSWLTGLDLERTLGCLDRVSIPAGNDAQPASRVAAHREQLADGQRIIADIQPAQFGGGSDLGFRLKALADAGVDGFTFYNYGLLRTDQLEWVGAASGLWS